MLGAAAEGDDSAKPGLRKGMEKDTRYPSSTIHEDIMVTLNIPLQSSSSNDVATADLSRSSLDAEHTGERPPHPHGRFDIV